MKYLIVVLLLLLNTVILSAQNQGQVIRDVPGHSVSRFICPTDGQTLVWQAAFSNFICGSGGGGSSCTADDKVGIGNGATETCTSIPDCDDTAGNHLNYDTATNALSCGTSGAASCTTDDRVPVGNGTSADCKTIPDCTDSGGNHLNYTQSSNTWSCGTSGSSSLSEGTGIDITSSVVSMDIHNGLSSTTVASSDEVPVQDVSVGNAVGDQRRTTAGAIADLTACNTDDQVPTGDGSSPPTCSSVPQCNEAIGEVLKYTTSTNTFSCVNILSDAGGGTPFDAGRHFMFASPSGSAGIPTYEGITSGENGLGTAQNSPTTINSHVSLRRCATTSAAECGWPGVGSANGHGVLKWRYDWKAKGYYTSAGGGADDTLFNYYAGFGSTAGSTLDSVNCTSAGGTDNLEGYWFCFNKANDSSWQACSGDGADWDCDDTGVAAPTQGDLWTMRIDARDMANVAYYINGALVDTRTSLLPSTSSTGAVGRTMIAKTTATTTQVQVGMGFIEMTWD